MTTALNRVARAKTPERYDRKTFEQNNQAFERALGYKYDRRGHLYLEPGKELVLTSDNSQNQFGLGLNNEGYLRLLNMATGAIGTFTIAWSQIDGATQEITNLTAYVDAADATLTASVNTNASAITVNGTAISSIETELTAAREGEVSLLANITDVRTAFASADAAIAADVTTLTAEVNNAREGESNLLANLTSIRTAFATADAAEASNRLILEAELDTEVINRQKNAALPPGLQAGATGDIKFEPNKVSDGTANNGEVRVLAGYLDHPTAGRWTLGANTSVTTPFEGSTVPDGGLFYLVFSDNNDLATRFSSLSYDSADRLFLVTYDESDGSFDAWDNSGSESYTPVDTDVVVAAAQKFATSGGIEALRSYVGYSGTLKASVETEETARVAGDAAEAAARASLQSSLESEDATLQANIDSEETARIAADTAEASARATAITNIEAQYREEVNRVNLVPAQYIMPAEAEYDADPNAWSHDDMSQAGTSLDNGYLGRDALKWNLDDTDARLGLFPDSGGSFFSNYDERELIYLEPGEYAFRIRFRGQPNINRFRLILRGSDGQYNNVYDDSSFNTDEWVTLRGTFDTTGFTTTEFSIEFRVNSSSTSSDNDFWYSRFQICDFLTGEDVDEIPWIPVDPSARSNRAAVRTISEALATGSSSSARLLLAVNTANNEASLEAYAGEGDGVWDGSKITFTADDFEFNGDVVVNGTLTTESLAANAVTSSGVEQNAASTSLTSGSYVEVIDLDFTSVGIGVEIRASCDVEVGAFTPGTPSAKIDWELRRGTTVLKSGSTNGAIETTTPGGLTYNTVRGTVVVDYNDLPSSGTYNYNLRVQVTNGGGTPTQSATNRFISAREFKR